MITLIFDTETTGLPDWKAPSGADHQPHLTQIAGALFDGDDRVLASVNSMVQPDGWSIPAELQEMCGFTEDEARRYGIPEAQAFEMMERLMLGADLIVAHNISFDMRIMRIAAKRYGSDERADALKGLKCDCTMQMASAIMKMAPTEKMKAAGFNKPKPLKLEEAHQHFFGAAMSGAHNAMADVMACRRVWMHIRDLKEGEAA